MEKEKKKMSVDLGHRVVAVSLVSAAFVFSFFPSLTKGMTFESKWRKGADANFAQPQRRHAVCIKETFIDVFLRGGIKAHAPK